MEKENKKETPDVVAEVTTATTDDGVAKVAEVEKPTGGRVKAFWAEKFPDKTYESDEEFDGLLADHLADIDERMRGHETAEQAFREVAKNHPELLDMVEALADDPDMSLAEALYRNVDEDEFFPEEGAPDFERMRNARKERMGRREAAAARSKALADNLAVSEGVVRDWLAKNEMSEDDQKALGNLIDSHLGAYIDNRITPEVLDFYLRAMRYDRDVADAREVGEIKGKNAKIDAERQRRREETDGLPSAGSAAVIKESDPAPKDWFDDVEARANSRLGWYK